MSTAEVLFLTVLRAKQFEQKLFFCWLQSMTTNADGIWIFVRTFLERECTRRLISQISIMEALRFMVSTAIVLCRDLLISSFMFDSRIHISVPCRESTNLYSCCFFIGHDHNEAIFREAIINLLSYGQAVTLASPASLELHSTCLWEIGTHLICLPARPKVVQSSNIFCLPGSKIVFTNGSQDPWRWASKQTSSPGGE